MANLDSRAFCLLRQSGWDVRQRTSKAPLPGFFSGRYDWLPREVQGFISQADLVVSPDEKSWFITLGELDAENKSAFQWNQWELDSLEVADGDLTWKEKIRRFWDDHCPLLLSVKSGYAHLSLRKEDATIVGGCEPEFEEVSVVAADFDSLMEMIARRDPTLSSYI